MPEVKEITRVKDLWDDSHARKLGSDQLGLLRYGSNLLGADLRITNFGGGNTSSKMEFPDPFTGRPTRVLAVKGSGGDLGSIKDSGFALLYLDRLEQLKNLYRGEQYEHEMVSYYPLAAFGENRVPASIDTPLHAFLPFPAMDHLPPDWVTRLPASANGKHKLQAFSRKFDRRIIWLPWQRPGFELALLIERAVKENPGADGILLGGHGLFTWGQTQRDCYLNSIHTIDQMGEFVLEHQARKGVLFGGLRCVALPERKKIAAQILPALRGGASSNRRVLAHYADDADSLTFAGSKWAQELSKLGTSCPDHFVRTRVCPMFVPWNPGSEDVTVLKSRIQESLVGYRSDYKKYYGEWATSQSPTLRDSNPSVVIIPGLGLFGFGKNKKEARITTEFFVNAIHVMAGANALEDGDGNDPVPQARTPDQSKQFTQYHNYVALPRSEAFRIEYWILEDAKLQRMGPESEFSRQVAPGIGGASGIGRETALLLARQGAHVVVADADAQGAEKVAAEAAQLTSEEFVVHTAVDLSNSGSLSQAAEFAILQFGGIDIVINTAAIFPVPEDAGELTEAQWSKTFLVNVTGNYVLACRTEWIFADHKLPAAMVLTSSANALVPK